jgi:hypothetical protein
VKDQCKSKRKHCFAAPLSKDELPAGQHVTKLKKFSSLRHSPPTRARKATEQLHIVAFLNTPRQARSIQSLQTAAPSDGFVIGHLSFEIGHFRYGQMTNDKFAMTN